MRTHQKRATRYFKQLAMRTWRKVRMKCYEIHSRHQMEVAVRLTHQSLSCPAEIMPTSHWTGTVLDRGGGCQGRKKERLEWIIKETNRYILFVCFPAVTTHCGGIFHSPVAGFSLLLFEVSWSHTQRRVTFGRTPLDEWSIRRRDVYLTTHNTHNRQTSMPPVGFEPTVSAGERPQTHALDRAATGTGTNLTLTANMYEI